MEFDMTPMPAWEPSWELMGEDAAAHLRGQVGDSCALVVDYVFRHGGDLGFNDVFAEMLDEAVEAAGLSREDAGRVRTHARLLLEEGGADYFFRTRRKRFE